MIIPRRFENKRVLVTGAAQGIGFAVAKRFAQEGAAVFLVDSADEDRVRAAETEVRSAGAGASVGSVRGDVADEGALEDLFDRATGTLGGLDLLVNNAGINRGHASHEFPTDDFDRVLSVNLRSVFLWSRRALRHFLENGQPGIILNNSSNHEIQPKPGYLAYSVSKGGLGNLTRTLALEYADRGIRVNSVAPGATVTPLNRGWTEDPVKRARVESHIPLGRSATADEVAGVFAFLASDEAAYITGQTLYVDGGLTLHPEFRHNWSS